MPNDQKPTSSDEEIRTRAYLLWEREGCQPGKDGEYWLRAKAELDAELDAAWQAASMAASMEGETTDFVLPVLPISTPPSKSISNKLSADNQLKKAVGG
jgi:hypothetical protein